MSNENFLEKYNEIFGSYKAFKEETKEKLSNLLLLASKEFGDYLINSKGFIHYQEKSSYYYYDPKTHIGLVYTLPKDIDLEYSEYNSIQFLICYKTQNSCLFYNRQIFFFFKKEAPEKAFSRFKKYLGKTESSRIKEYLKGCGFEKEVVTSERAYKIKNIQK